MRCIPWLAVAALAACSGNDNPDDEDRGQLVATWQFVNAADEVVECPEPATDVKLSVTPEGDVEPLVQVTIPCDALTDTVVLDAGLYDLQLLLTDAAGAVVEVADPDDVSAEVVLGEIVSQAWVFTVD